MQLKAECAQSPYAKEKEDNVIWVGQPVCRSSGSSDSGTVAVLWWSLLLIFPSAESNRLHTAQYCTIRSRSRSGANGSYVFSNGLSLPWHIYFLTIPYIMLNDIFYSLRSKICSKISILLQLLSLSLSSFTHPRFLCTLSSSLIPVPKLRRTLILEREYIATPPMAL